MIMAAEKRYKCAFKHCIHESNELLPDQAVKIGNRYLHKDCAEIRQNIEKTRDIYYLRVSNTVVMSQLVKVIQHLVFNKKVDSGYLVFALTYALDNGMTIRSPYGLYYIVDNQRIKDAWSKKKAQETAEEIKSLMEDSKFKVDPKGDSFKFRASSVEGFESILKGINGNK